MGCRCAGLLALGLVVLLAAPARAQDDGARYVDVVQVSGFLDPVLVEFIGDSLTTAEEEGSEVFVLQLDSPGDLVSQAEVDALAFRLGHSEVPVAVWVGESGSARALGGAAQLVTSAPLAGMVRGTELGDLPDAIFGEAPAAVTDGTVGPEEAAELGFVDLDERESSTLQSFIAGLDGREVGGRTIDTGDFTGEGDDRSFTSTVQARLAKLPLFAGFLHTVASPPVAYLLLSAGLVLLVFELFTAGVGVAGGVGAVCLVLAAYGLAVLPTSPVGLALVVLGVFGFAVDIQVGVPRVWTAVGVVAFVVGSLLLFDAGVRLSWVPLVTGVAGVVLMMLAGLPATVRSRFSTPTIGRESMVGELGEAVADVRPDGVVRVRDALWPARTNRATPIAEGDRVRVVAVDGPRLEVEPEEGGARDYRR